MFMVYVVAEQLEDDDLRRVVRMQTVMRGVPAIHSTLVAVIDGEILAGKEDAKWLAGSVCLTKLFIEVWAYAGEAALVSAVYAYAVGGDPPPAADLDGWVRRLLAPIGEPALSTL